MFSTKLLRVCSIVLHSIMGGMCLFNLYYAGIVSDPALIRFLILNALIWGGVAGAILFYQLKYLEN